MQELTAADIQQISLYIPFKVAFAPLNRYNIITRSYPAGIIGPIVIASFDDFESAREICESWDLSHHELDERPVLRRLENMTQQEHDTFIDLWNANNVRPRLSVETTAELVKEFATPEIFLYALSRHFDLFGLIDARKATGLDT